MNSLTCDFCSDPSQEVMYEYRTKGNYELTKGGVMVTFDDDGRWAACRFCAYLIETNQPHALEEEIVTAAIDGRAVHGAPPDGLRTGSAGVMNFFWTRRLPGRLRVLDDERSDPITDADMREQIEDLAASLGLA